MDGMIPKTRKFNGEIYRLKNIAETINESNYIKQGWKSRGKRVKVRVIKLHNIFVVYVKM